MAQRFNYVIWNLNLWRWWWWGDVCCDDMPVCETILMKLVAGAYTCILSDGRLGSWKLPWWCVQLMVMAGSETGPSIISITSMFKKKGMFAYRCPRFSGHGLINGGHILGSFFFNFIHYWLFTLFTRHWPSYSRYLWGWTYKLLLPCTESCIRQYKARFAHLMNSGLLYVSKCEADSQTSAQSWVSVGNLPHFAV